MDNEKIHARHAGTPTMPLARAYCSCGDDMMDHEIPDVRAVTDEAWARRCEKCPCMRFRFYRWAEVTP